MTKKSTLNKALNRVVELAHGQAPLARAISKISGGDVKQGHVWSWLHRTGKVPCEYIIPASQAVGWKVTPHQLDPEVYPHPDDGLPDELRGRRRRAAEAPKTKAA